MSITQRIVNSIIKFLTTVLCRVYDEPLRHVPNKGPLLIVANHVNFLEVPILLTRLMPRPVTGLAKHETWQNPFFAFLFDLWEGIPVRRGEGDIEAIRRCREALKKNKIVAIAPEGTRSGDGRLLRGKPGIVFIAKLSNVPILPVAYYGGEDFWKNLKRLRRTDFHILVGKPFVLETGKRRIDRETRQQIVDEIMYQIAFLLPTKYRGYYTDIENASQEFIRFTDFSHCYV